MKSSPTRIGRDRFADRIIVFSQRPARIVSEIDVAAVFGPERPLSLRDEERFFRMKTELLHLVRRTAGVEP